MMTRMNDHKRFTTRVYTPERTYRLSLKVPITYGVYHQRGNRAMVPIQQDPEHAYLLTLNIHEYPTLQHEHHTK